MLSTGRHSEERQGMVNQSGCGLKKTQHTLPLLVSDYFASVFDSVARRGSISG